MAADSLTSAKASSGLVTRSGYAIAESDGSPIFYEVIEPGPEHSSDIETVMLCDGIGCDGYVWKYLRNDLEGRYRIVHSHYRGHGRSPKPRDPARIAVSDLADDLVAVLDDIEVAQVTLFGHSMGVQVVLETYRRHRDRINAMVLLCGAPENPLKTFGGSSTAEAVLPMIRFAVDRAPRLFNALARTLLPTRLSYEIATRIEINGELMDAADFMPYLRGLSLVEVHFFLAMLNEAAHHSAVDLLPDVAVPTLVVVGDQDGFTPPDQGRMIAEEVPNAELLVIEGGSHTAPLERPDLVGPTITEFLERRLGAAHRSTEKQA